MSQTPTPPTPSTVKTRILIISDTHTAPLISDTHTAPLTSSIPKDAPFRYPLPKADVLLHCGDLTHIGKLDEYEKALDMLGSIDAGLKLVIAGNHDISLDGEYFARRGADLHGLGSGAVEGVVKRAKELWTGDSAKKAGVTYLEEGTYSFTLVNGARLRIHTSPHTPEFCAMAFPYKRNEDRFNPAHLCTPSLASIPTDPIPTSSSIIPDFPQIDILMTHGPPKGILDSVPSAGNVGCAHLLRAVRRAKPKLHCFGHIHEGWGAERVTWMEKGNPDGVQGSAYASAEVEGMIKGREKVVVDKVQMRRDKAMYVDVSSEAPLQGEKREEGDTVGRELEVGRETLFVNASIMDVRYRPVQGAWLVDLDLERVGAGE